VWSASTRCQATLDVNLSASFYMAQAVGRVMIDAGHGRIINLASQAAVIGLDQHAAYCASKADRRTDTRPFARMGAKGHHG
jgi:2-deoxy-D-gluconate 3-dehydrogenase